MKTAILNNPYNQHWRLFVEMLSQQDKVLVESVQIKGIKGWMNRIPDDQHLDVPEDLRDFYTLEVALDVNGSEVLLRRLDYLSEGYSFLGSPYVHELGWLVDGVRTSIFSIDGKRLEEVFGVTEKQGNRMAELFFEEYGMSLYYSDADTSIEEHLAKALEIKDKEM